MTLLVIIVVFALVFDFINGFHDAANSIATIVTTKVLSPLQAVLWAGAFNFMAFFVAKYVIGEFGIANTVAKTVIEQYATMPVVFAGLLAAIAWNLLTWWLGIPSSSSHTLIGGFAGAAICASGFGAIHTGVILKIASFIVLAPLIGMLVAIAITLAILWSFKNVHQHKAERIMRKMQLASSALFSLGHGLNDSQKVMGIIATSMIAAGQISSLDEMPNWVSISCFSAIGLGTMMGGWKIVKTMGGKITKISSLEGVSAETAGAITLFITEILKIPVSTTHTLSGAIMGVGAVRRVSSVRWGITIKLLWAWILTIPVSAVFAAVIYALISPFI